MIGRRVAIKVLHPQVAADPQMVERLFNEARASNRVRHRGIVDIHDCGRSEDGRAYLVMELLEGVEGGIDRETVRAGLRNGLNLFKYCYGSALDRNPELHGRVTLFFKISGVGTVLDPEITSSTWNSGAADRCLAGAAAHLRFQPGAVGFINVALVFRALPER